MSHYHTLKKQKAIENGVHVMNKNESKKMRQLQIQTGLSKEEILKEKKYRIMLSEAQDAGEKELSLEGKVARLKKKILKNLTVKLKLPKEHPLVVSEYKEKLEKLKKINLL